jgi:membrane protein involved in colicin uptake
MEFAQDGWALKVTTSNVNKDYCEVIRATAQKAKFPGFNNPKVYRDFQKAGFDMRGYVDNYC